MPTEKLDSVYSVRHKVVNEALAEDDIDSEPIAPCKLEVFNDVTCFAKFEQGLERLHQVEFFFAIGIVDE